MSFFGTCGASDISTFMLAYRAVDELAVIFGKVLLLMSLLLCIICAILFNESIRWLAVESVAAKGFADAENNLGIMYLNGKGVPQDDAKAVDGYRKAAAQGNAGAQKMLDAMH